MPETDNEPLHPPRNFEYIQKAFQILFLNRSTMADVGTDPKALGFALVLAACGGALSVIPHTNWKAFLFFSFYAVVSLFLFSGFVHILAGYTKGKEHYMGLVRISGFASIIDGLAAFPVLAIPVTIWGVTVAVVATQEIYGLSKGKAILYVLLSLSALWVVTILLLTGPFGYFYPPMDTTP